jgi:hypothetical protein
VAALDSRKIPLITHVAAVLHALEFCPQASEEVASSGWPSIQTCIIAQQTAMSKQPPLHPSSDEDHQRTLDLRRSTSLRRGGEGDPNRCV